MNKQIKYLLLLILALALAACGGETDTPENGSETNGQTGQTTNDTQLPTGDPVAGEEQYNMVCIACHGPEGTGIENLGKPLNSSEFVHSQTDAELLAFIKVGRPSSDPANTTGVDMPPKGGNPALSDQQIMDIIAYLRTLEE